MRCGMKVLPTGIWPVGFAEAPTSINHTTLRMLIGQPVSRLGSGIIPDLSVCHVISVSTVSVMGGRAIFSHAFGV